MQKRVAVLGASGYAGVELTKILDGHPHVEVAVASSDRWVGDTLAARTGVRSALRYVSLDAAIEEARHCDVALLATPAEASHELVPKLVEHTRVIDLSGAFRLKDPARHRKYYGFEHAHVALAQEAVYGVPELFRERIAGARFICNPGCYATAIQLALAPLLAADRSAPASDGGVLDGRIIVDAMSGVTGAGRKATEELSFAEIAGSVRAYRVLRHQHEPEIEQSLGEVAGRAVDITFVPHLLPVKRGILATCHAHLAATHDVGARFERWYGREPFISLAPTAEQVSLHDVVGTNLCRIGASVGDNGDLVVIAAIDNLVKGAAGQAVQNLNLMLGLDEQAGLAGLRSFHP